MNILKLKNTLYAESLISSWESTIYESNRRVCIEYEFKYNVFRDRVRSIALKILPGVGNLNTFEVMSQARNGAITDVFKELRIKRHLDKFRVLTKNRI